MHILWLLLLNFENPTLTDNMNVQAYQFHVSVFDETDRIEGRAVIQVRIDGSDVSQLNFDLVGPAPEKATGMTVTSVRREDQTLAFSQSEEQLHITLAQPAKTGDQFALEITYGGIPADGLIIARNKYGARTFFADNWPNRAHHWLPCVDHPGDKAACSFEVDAPNHYQVISNGVLRESSDLPHARRRTLFESQIALPTKVMVIGVAQFAVQHLGATEGIPLSSWVFPEEREKGFANFQIAKEILSYLTAYLGPFPYPELANVQSRTRFGGMENAGAIFYSEKVFEKEADGLIAHEMAHQWFGDAISESDWPHIWLSEGFATYFSWRYLAFAHGEESLVENLAKARERILAAKAEKPKPIIREEADLMDYLDANSYQRGGYVLHMLSLKIGEAAFQKSLRAFFEHYRDQNASSQQFQDIVEQTVGENLSGFFDQWLKRADLPKLKLSWSWSPETHELMISIQQDPEHWFALDLPILLKEDGSDTLHTLSVDGPAVKLSLKTAKPLELIANPSGEILTEEILLNQP